MLKLPMALRLCHRRAMAQTFNPSEVNARTVAAPMPEDAPVTRADVNVESIIIILAGK